MDISTSEYGSGCASGWTMYLDPFSSSSVQYWDRSMPFDNDCQSKGGGYVHEDEEDEDLSMLSDASSGPPHFHQDEDSSEETRCNTTMTVSSEPKRSKHRKKVRGHRRKQQSFHLDDTASASSPVLSFSKAPQRALFLENNAVHNNDNHFMAHDSNLSQGFSATHCKGKSALKKHFGFFKSSITGKAD